MVSKRFSLAVLAASACCATPAVAGEYKETFVWLAQGQPAVLYEPVAPGPKADITIFAMHPLGDYLAPRPTNTCMQLASRGYRALCANASSSKTGLIGDMNQDRLTLNVKAGMEWLRKQPWAKKVVIFGHSGGGAMMAAYQNIAENGVKVCQDPAKLIPCPDTLANLPAADGVMLIDSSMGMPGSNMISIDPSIIDDEDSTKVDPSLDMYNPANGFNPAGSTYSPEFKARFFAAQASRMNRLIAKAQARLALIKAGKGRFKDDEPFIVAGAVPDENKLNNQDVSLLSRTQGSYPLLHAGGRMTTGVVPTVRVPHGTASPTPLLENTLETTVKTFLSTFAIRALPDYGYDETGFHGIDFNSSYGATYNNVPGISKPLLQMGLTGSYEYSFVEGARARATKSQDKTVAYVEGATHGFRPCTECAAAKGLPADYYGDTVKTLYDYIDGWLSKPGRFQ
ncbi:alpha/beta hydrolase [Novosphingobium flavum]|uniref:Alpha/beta hydrolase n=1 Tax=Novosphingobium flavum TaxID=1778672 RepID=A0A7X1KLJ0_9SPHN|nr:alpha/beta hydrolase [Novosphingobium flavum]MBC2665353.1 alpha/beta hydrolase [Novosphingobium flavum]